MLVLRPNLDLDTFFQTVRAASQRALLLDYEGISAPFRLQRNQAFLSLEVRAVLNTILQAGHTRLVIISRCVPSDLVPLLGLNQRPEIWGSRGWERLLPDGRYTITPLGAHLAQGLAQARVWIEEQGLQHTCEDNPASIAVNYRGLSPRAADTLRAEVLQHWSPLAQETGLIIEECDGGIELRAPGHNKGVAVRSVRIELGLMGVVAYLSHDTTDEDVFRAVQPPGIGVLVRDEFHTTAADLWLQPSTLPTFLSHWHQSSQREGSS